METVSVDITAEQREYANKVANDIADDKKSSGYKDRGGNARQNADEVGFLGYLGETVFADEYDLERPEVIEGDLDDGWDFVYDGHKVDVKATSTNHLILFPKAPWSETGKQIDYYASVQIDPTYTEAEISWVSRKEFIEKSESYDYGYGIRWRLHRNEFS